MCKNLRPRMQTLYVLEKGLQLLLQNKMFYVLQFREAFQRISSPSHFRTTLLLASLHLLLGFVYNGISTYSTNMIKEINDRDYYALKRHIVGVNYTGRVFNSTEENVEYGDSIFKNVTFRHLNLNHVEFVNCLFEDVEFTNVKSSISTFENSTIKNCR